MAAKSKTSKSTKSRVSSRANKNTDKKLFIALGFLVIALVAIAGIVWYRQSQAMPAGMPKVAGNGLVRINYPYSNNHVWGTKYVCYWQGYATGAYNHYLKSLLVNEGWYCTQATFGNKF